MNIFKHVAAFKMFKLRGRTTSMGKSLQKHRYAQYEIYISPSIDNIFSLSFFLSLFFSHSLPLSSILCFMIYSQLIIPLFYRDLCNNCVSPKRSPNKSFLKLIKHFKFSFQTNLLMLVNKFSNNILHWHFCTEYWLDCY